MELRELQDVRDEGQPYDKVRLIELVVSVSANGINAIDNLSLDYGATARGELVQEHLNIWHDLSTSGSSPFGRTFVGKVDLSRIGTMGHSSGGEGVLFHYLLNKRLNTPFMVRAVLPLAAMNQKRLKVSGVPLGIVLPYCNGDLADLQGIHYYDDSRYALPGDPALARMARGFMCPEHRL
ncbi:MAG: hypothetical protein HY261_02250 [Chloroflexi bacterium]|nr:hypothetical protein [Chloroflexota bacterium]